MDILTTVLFSCIGLLIAVIGYFLKRILDQTDSIGSDVSDMKPKLEILWKDKLAPSSSPRQLNERGSSILEVSGINEIVNQKKDRLFQIIKEKNPKNPYDAENVITKVMEDLPEHCPDMIDQLKQGAFKAGTDIQTVLFVGSVYLRNLIFEDLGFSLEDLDKSSK